MYTFIYILVVHIASCTQSPILAFRKCALNCSTCLLLYSQVVRTADFKDWTLQVKYAQPRDSGIYECQVNTEPKISMAFRLNVIGE